MKEKIEALFFAQVEFENSVRIALALLVLIFLILIIVTSLISKIIRKESFFSKLIAKMFPAVMFSIFVLTIYSVVNIFFEKTAENKYFDILSRIFFVLAIAYIFYRMTHIVKYSLTSWRDRRGKTTPDDMAVKWITVFIKILIIFLMSFSILRIFNIKLTGFIAGLGIGGIAVALAAQDSISNVLGFILIMLDKPFTSGERVKMLDYDGTIEEVGIRSTKIRTLEGCLVIIPNKTIANANIENIAARKTIRNFENIELDESTIKLKDLPSFIERIKIILSSTENVTDESQVFFDNSDGAKIVIKMWYWIDVNDYWIYMQKKEEINYRICDLFEKEGVKYYMPTNTVYIKKGDEA